MGFTFWITIFLAVLLVQFGFKGVIYILAFLCSFLFGVFGYFIYKGYITDKCQNGTASWKCLSSKGITKLLYNMETEKKHEKLDTRITGSSVIDNVLKDIIDYIMRDYVLSWYQTISDEEKFPLEARKCLQKSLSNLSNRVKEVDWIPFFTEQFADDFGSHIRLYHHTSSEINRRKADENNFDACFFQLETEMEKKAICREHICIDRAKETEYLRQLCNFILYFLMPPNDFKNRPLRFLLREIVVNFLFLPTIDLISDPDYINQYIIWMCKDNSYTLEYFLQAISICDNEAEMDAIIDTIDAEISRLRGCDSGGSDDASIKAQLQSLCAVRKKCKDRARIIHESRLSPILPGGESVGLSKFYRQQQGQNMPDLSIDKILSEPNSGNCYLEFLKTIGMERYLELYFNLDRFHLIVKTFKAFRQSTEQRLFLVNDNPTGDHHHTSNNSYEEFERLREQASTIFNSYVITDRDHFGLLDDGLLQRTKHRIHNESPSETLFEEIQDRLYDILRDDRTFGKFKSSEFYFKALVELDMLREGSIVSEEDYLLDEDDSIKSSDGCESLWLSDTLIDSDLASVNSANSSNKMNNSYISNMKDLELVARIHKIGGVHKDERVVYFVISVTRRRLGVTDDKLTEKWNVYRRFSDFDDFHQLLQKRCNNLGSLKLPPKTATRQLGAEFIERRRQDLDVYLQVLLGRSLQVEVGEASGLLIRELASNFVEPGRWEKRHTHIARSVGSAFVQPLRSSVRNVSSKVRGVPDSLVDGMMRVSGGVGRLLSSGGGGGTNERRKMLNAAKMADTLDIEDAENIPLRIASLILLEVFDLSNRNMLFRRQLLLVVRTLVTTFAGSAYNQKIVELAERLMSADSIAEYLTKLRESFWPGGKRAPEQAVRDRDTQLRTRLVCRTKMLGSLPTELGTFLGSDTVRRGIQRLFNMTQRRSLNRRFIYVIFEGILCKLFPESAEAPARSLKQIIRHLHRPPTPSQSSDSNSHCEATFVPPQHIGKSSFFA